MFRSFLPTTKTEWRVLIVLTILLTIGATASLVFRSIYAATGVSAPVTITITEPSSNQSYGAVATRISRGGARFALTSDYPGTWYTSEWVRAIEIQIVGDSTQYNRTTMQVGPTTYELALTDVPYTTTGTTRTHTVSLTELGRTGTTLPFFGTILNWPGDGTALTRALYINSLVIFLFFIGTTLLILGYQYWVRTSSKSVTTVNPNQPDVLLAVACFVLSTISTLLFIHHGPTAYDWPALDMGPFFMRAADQTFLLNDFFTNASAHPNPRFVFGSIVIGIGTLLHLSWYGVFFLLKSLLVVFLPPLLLVTLYSFFSHLPDPRKQLQIIFSLFCFVLLALFPLFVDQFTIALWSPYQVTPTPHALAFFIGLCALYTANTNRRVLSVLAWILTTALLPTIALSLLGLYLITHWHTLTKQDFWLYAGIGVISPSIFLAYWFAPTAHLSSLEFVYHYVTSNHSIHYLPSAFETSTVSPLPWYVHFCLIIGVLLLTALVGYHQKNRYLWVAASLAVLAYIGAVVSCYLCIELYPNKLIAMIGPSRFTLLGYWFIALFTTHLITTIPTRYFPFLALFTTPATYNLKKIRLGIILVLSLVAAGLATTYQDDPQATWRATHTDLATWISHTAPGDVFASNNLDLNVNIPLVAHRAIFSGNGFPFNQDDFIAFDTRRALMYGSPLDWAAMSGNSDRIKSDNFYRRLTPADFARIAATYQLDYVIIESSFSEQFASYTPIFTNANIRIYRVSDFTPSL